ncbi:hypothetical protein [Gemmatimonas sp.]
MTHRTSYAKVDRSDFTPNSKGRAGDEVVDIGWAEGVLQDGRPYHLECWSLAGTTGVTVFMASDGLEASDPRPVHTLLEASGVITTLEEQELTLHRFTDPAGTPCVSISYIVADEDDEFFVEAHPLLTSYWSTGATSDAAEYVGDEDEFDIED